MNESVFPDLVRAAAAGDQNALTELYNLTYNDVYSTAKFLVKDEDAALDILQDSYIKAFASMNALSDPSKFRPWIKRIAHNMAIDQLRRKKPVVFSSMTESEDDALPEFRDDHAENLPDVSLDQQETARLVREILDSLPDEQRTCITLYYYEQMSVREIAVELGIPEATVKSRLQYGRRKIEAAVRDLEKKGTKLYGLAPLPFFLLLLRNYEAQLATGVSDAVRAEIVRTALSARSAAATAHASMAAGKAVGAAAHAVLRTKIIAGVLAVLLIGGGITAVVRHQNQKVPASAPDGSDVSQTDQTAAPEDEPAVVPEPEPPATQSTSQAAEQAYGAILVDYRNFISDMLPPYSENDIPIVDNPDYADILYYWHQDDVQFDWLMMQFQSKYEKGGIAFHYAVRDINGDGTDELILALYESQPDFSGWTPFEIYTFDGTKAVPLIRGHEPNGTHPQIHFVEGGILCMDYGNSYSTEWFYRLPAGGTELELIDRYEPIMDGYPVTWEGAGGRKITDDELSELYPNHWNYDANQGYQDIYKM
ncbi:MAG: RNA polymerase sigma factor [Mogibacterium sp.]|nr:RNA polymerase sigma factor [Mogibacterium sp.]